ncbi:MULTISPECIES: hypothetical protein [Hyphomicrobiales]|jgi:hypothetical protein|uniref:hypothetical protein n=1 Tax=Hyphomicrobiales TaxID=356 RepID=UPI0006485FFC|nr:MULTISPECIES: hypothetical protein [Hyphomicrobiales]RKD74105.1 hypothetical protein BJ928_101454 [Rhizobium sp. WW_1]RZS83899.1 hypothetical protein EV217_2650 [Phyllobacterium myrsinacearum]
MKMFDITELDTFKPALVEFLKARFGRRVSGTHVLMLTEISQLLTKRNMTSAKRHQEVVMRIRLIASLSRRPQRVPTFREWSNFAVEIRNVAASRVGGEPLVADPRNPKFVKAIFAHELAAKADRIVGTVSRAPLGSLHVL